MAEGISARISWALSKAIKGASSNNQSGRSLMTATVTRKDPDGTIWVRMAGSDIDTPVNGLATSNVSAGDVVQCQIDGTALSVTGNASDPAVGASKAFQMVNAVVKPISMAVSTAHGIAKAAQRVANAVNQHFWADTSGVHVTQATQEEWESQQSGPNVLINSLGQLFRDGLNNLLTMTTEDGARAMAVWDGLGNGASNILAYFGEMVRIGRSNQGHVAISTHESTEDRDPSYAEMSLYGADGATKDIRIYSRDAAIGDDFDDYELTFPAMGIEFGGGHNAGKTSIYMLDEDFYDDGGSRIDNHLYITNGSEKVTTDSSVNIRSQRAWATNPEKFNRAAAWTDTGTAGTVPSAGMSAQSGDKVTYVRLETTSVASTARIEADKAYVAGNLITTAIGWTNLPLSTQAKAWTAATTPRYCRHLGIVQLTGEASPRSAVAASGTITIGTLPVGCRPPRRISVLCQGSGVREWMLQIDTDGTVQASRYRLGNAAVEMPTDAWLAFHVMFVPA